MMSLWGWLINSVTMKNNMEQADAVSRYTIDRREREMVTALFLSDPITSLHLIRDDVVEDYGGDLTNVGLVAVEYLHEVYDDARETYANIPHEVVRDFLACQPQDVLNKNKFVITLLKEAGYSKTEVMTWAKIESDDESPQQRLLERSARAFVEQIYSDE